jgi:DNA-binding response OmpR family regulator
MTKLASVAVASTAAQITDSEILVIDSDQTIGRTIVDQLTQDGFAAVHGQTAGHARSLARHRALDAVVLGRLPGPRSALDLLCEIRRAREDSCWEPSVPVLMLSDRTEEVDIIRAFTGGADDFIGRPVRYTELLARLQAVLRRVPGAQSAPRYLRVGELEIDTFAHTVSVAGQRIELCRREFELLVHLASEPERVFTKPELLRAVWAFQSMGVTRTVDSHACRLRCKLEAASDRHWVINVWGVGYSLYKS